MSLSNETATKQSDLATIYPPIEVPSPPLQVSMNDPNFDKLTTAEKLNDSDYRNLIYRTYPNEPTCACRQETSNSKTTNNKESLDIVSKAPRGSTLVCHTGCRRACCSSVRQPGIASYRRDNANKDDNKVPQFVPTYCVGNPRDDDYDKCSEYNEDKKNKAYNSSYCDGEKRLRGGGEGEEGTGEEGMYPQCSEVNQVMVRWFDDARNGRNGCASRQNANADCGEVDFGCEAQKNQPVNSKKTCYMDDNLVKRQERKMSKKLCKQDAVYGNSYFNSSPDAGALARDTFRPAAGCCCPGKDVFSRGIKKRESISAGSCIRKPCLSVDCLVKAFKEAENFVESLGKVPGLAGLGLMDPEDSPYFGRDRITGLNYEETKVGPTVSGNIGLPNPQCGGVCNTQMQSNLIESNGTYDGATPFTIAVPGRAGIVREAVPSMPRPGLSFASGKLRKKDEKERGKEEEQNLEPIMGIERGPCGEQKCKAKRRKSNASGAESIGIKPAEMTTKKVVALEDINSTERISRTGKKVSRINKDRAGHRSLESGAKEDRIERSRSTGKSGRRMIRFVYSVGDAYSGFTCGHKNCVEERRRVPGNMGWLWNPNETDWMLKPRPGWKPGAIARHVSEILREAKANFLQDRKSRTMSRNESSRSRSRSTPSRGKGSKTRRDRSRTSVKKSQKNEEEEEEEREPPPTLHIQRKDGTYYVTMYPIKQETMNRSKVEEPMKPLQFKIAKNRDDVSIASSSTASDMEIEFTPPAAVNRNRKKPNVVHIETQVKQQEIIDAFKSSDNKKKEKKKGKKGKK